MDNERIPTMPQGMESDRIPTMPQGMESDRIPTMPQGVEGDRIATMPQGMQAADGRVATMPQQGGSSTQSVQGRFLVTQNITFTGKKGNSFVIEASDIVSADSGESQIYGCRKIGNNEKYVARVLMSVTPQSDPAKLKTREKVIYFLETASGNPYNYILPLIDHATIRIGFKEYFVEVYPYCEEGDLGRRKGNIPYEEIRDKIVPAINTALHAFHSVGLVHRDVKPDNLYYYKGRVVLGDFGITCDLREDGFATDKYKTGTLGYYAPELMSQAAIRASDYYSFGQTIWTLYSGEMMYRNILRMYKDQGVEEQRNQINFAMLKSQYYGLDEISKEDAFFEILIRGLLQYDPTERFDYEKVKRWLAGDRSLSNEIASYKDDNTFTREFRICGKECWDSTDVYKTLCDNWEEGKELLYSGALKDFYASQSYEMARYFDSIMKKYTYHEDENMMEYFNNIGLAETIRFLSDNKVLCWKGQQIVTLKDLGMAANKAIDSYTKGNKQPLMELFELFYSWLIVEWYQEKKNCEESVLNILKDMRDMIAMNNYATLTVIRWASMLFMQAPELVHFDNCNNMTELVDYMLAEPWSMYVKASDESQLLVESVVFLSFLCTMGYQDVAKVFLSKLDDNLCNRYEMLYDFIESVAEGSAKEAVRKHYSSYGPRSFYIWWKNNLSVYEFVGADVLTLKQQIEQVAIHADTPIQKQRATIAELAQLYIKFKQYDVSDIFLEEMGLIVPKGKNNIKAKCIEGVWNYTFLGNVAPIGYKYFMQI